MSHYIIPIPKPTEKSTPIWAGIVAAFLVAIIVLPIGTAAIWVTCWLWANMPT